jgi:transketolase
MITTTTASVSSTLGMRDAYFAELYRLFQTDRKAVLLSADDGGSPALYEIAKMPGQFRNVGIAEQQMVGMACGLAMEGRRVWVYAINPFIAFRAIEFLKLDMCAMNLPITAVGIAAGFAYSNMGPTHHSVGSVPVLRAWPNLTLYNVADCTTAAALAAINHRHNGPQYVLLDRQPGIPDLYSGKGIDFRDGLVCSREGKDGYIISHGIMVHQALKIAEELQKKRVNLGVIDLFRLKPVNKELLLHYLGTVPRVITLEEEYLRGGAGSIIAEIFVDHEIMTPLLRIGQPDEFVFQLGGREAIWRLSGLDVESVSKEILDWL